MNTKRLALILLAVFIFAPFAGFTAVYARFYFKYSDLKEFKPKLPTRLYDIHGKLISELYEEHRTYLPSKEIPEIIKNAFIAAEDQSFYRHSGIDLAGILRAAAVDIASGSVKQGGSTITQQLVKQIYTGSERSLTRKVIELFISREIEKRLSKDKIIELYLNQIYFGHGVYGTASAAEFFFMKPLSELGPIEAAFLASIPSAPEKFSPLKNPKNLYEKHKSVLFSMVMCGFTEKKIIDEGFDTFWKKFMEDSGERYFTVGRRDRRYDLAPHFTEHVRRILVSSYGEDRIYKGGLIVQTTLDLGHQTIAGRLIDEETERQNNLASPANSRRAAKADSDLAGELIKKGLAGDNLKTAVKAIGFMRNESADEINFISMLYGCDIAGETAEKYIFSYEGIESSSAVQGAFIAVDHSSGAVRAMVGGSGFNSSNQLNRAVQARRQPGSAFKIFVYGAGVENKKISPGSMFLDMPVTYKSRSRIWSPGNYDKQYRGEILAREAFAISLNIVSILIYETTGGSRIIDFSSKLMNIPKSRFQNDATLAIGTSEITISEMASGVSVIANGGYAAEPYCIESIADPDGKKVFGRDNNRKNKKRLLSPAASFILTSLMKSVVDAGTASYPIRKSAGYKGPAAGKTGTNTDFRDAWFAGFTPELTAVVWFGCDSQIYTLGYGQSGASVAAPVWGRFMKEIYTSKKTGYFPGAPESVISTAVCLSSGKIPGTDCRSRNEYFIKGTEPEEHCDSLHYEMKSVLDLHRGKKGTRNTTEVNTKDFE